jgi:hypothetical protein
MENPPFPERVIVGADSEGLRMIDVTPEPTPNPNALKFTLDRASVEGRSQTFRAGSDPTESPLGARIFALDGVTNVFMVSNFVSVTKEDDVSWEELVPKVIDELQTHFA